MFEPTEEMKEAYRLIRDGLYPSSNSRHLADLAQHATAAALEAEHVCEICSAKSHDWLRLADEKLREVKR